MFIVSELYINYHIVIVTVPHPVHVMNVECSQVPADPQTKSTDLGHESACRLLSSAPATQPES